MKLTWNVPVEPLPILNELLKRFKVSNLLPIIANNSRMTDVRLHGYPESVVIYTFQFDNADVYLRSETTEMYLIVNGVNVSDGNSLNEDLSIEIINLLIRSVLDLTQLNHNLNTLNFHLRRGYSVGRALEDILKDSVLINVDPKELLVEVKYQQVVHQLRITVDKDPLVYQFLPIESVTSFEEYEQLTAILNNFRKYLKVNLESVTSTKEYDQLTSTLNSFRRNLKIDPESGI